MQEIITEFLFETREHESSKSMMQPLFVVLPLIVEPSKPSLYLEDRFVSFLDGSLPFHMVGLGARALGSEFEFRLGHSGLMLIEFVVGFFLPRQN